MKPTNCKTLRIVLLALVALHLGGCAAPRVDRLSDEDLRELSEDLVCEGADACAFMWRRAQVWVVNNAGYKIQTATDTVIETFNPARAYESRWAIQIVRHPLTPTRDRLELRPSCGASPLCGSATRLELKFKREMRAP